MVMCSAKNELETTWKKAVWPNLRYYYRIFIECLSKIMTHFDVDRQYLD